MFSSPSVSLPVGVGIQPVQPTVGDVSSTSASVAAAASPTPPTLPLEVVKHAYLLLFKSMHEGWLAQWVKQFVREDVKLIVAAKLNDRSEDRSCIGRDNMVQYYNNVVKYVWGGPNNNVKWTVDSIVPLTPSCIAARFSQTITRDGVSKNVRRTFTAHVDGIEVAEIIISPVDPSEDMDPEILACRDCIPPRVMKDPISEEEKETDEQKASASAMPSLTCPCNHNDWDSVRVKRGWCLLRCRTCTLQWRIKASDVDRCVPFITSGCNATECSKFHIHLRKQRQGERHTMEE